MILAVGWLVGCVLWHISFCRLFKAKSIFMHVHVDVRKQCYCILYASLKTMVSDDNAVAPISSLLAGTGIVMKENNYVYDSEEGNINHTEASGSQHMYFSQYYNRDDWRYNHDIKPNMKFLYIYIYIYGRK